MAQIETHLDSDVDVAPMGSGARNTNAPARARERSGFTGWVIRPLFGHAPPLYTYVGLLLTLLSWYSSWSRTGPWMYTFFPIWFGFIFVLDGLNVARRGTSLLTRSALRFVALFPISAVFWWVFEWFNNTVHNWAYLTDHPYTPLMHWLIATLDFSTVLPAFLEMAELLASVSGLRPRLALTAAGPRAPLLVSLGLIGLGVAAFILPFLFPQYTYVLIWVCLALIIDPLNNLLGRRSAVGHLLAGDWRFLVTVPLAALLCGACWEMWNYYALPKWVYNLPYLNWTPHIFEMPLPGYLGYLPFGLELFAMYELTLWLLRQRSDGTGF